EKLQEYHSPVPFLLSGGIGPDDADRIKKLNHPQLAGIDLNSRFESAPGVKDVEKLRSFLTALKD
ncbi:MAG: phosphoribosylanthranilate isomerase, partial [Bacteroidota bacterium]